MSMVKSTFLFVSTFSLVTALSIVPCKGVGLAFITAEDDVVGSSVDAVAVSYATIMAMTTDVDGGDHRAAVQIVTSGSNKPHFEVNDGSSGFTSSLKAIGRFVGGTDADEQTISLPSNLQEGSEVYIGGLGIDSGVVLCTGFITNADGTPDPPSPLSPSLFGVGLEGPNNGWTHAFAPVFRFVDQVIDESTTLIDEDIKTAAPSAEVDNSGDPAVIELSVVLERRGRLQFSLVYGSDEAPFFTAGNDDFNDIAIISVDADGDGFEQSENSLTFNVIINNVLTTSALLLKEIEECTNTIWIFNQSAPKLDGSSERIFEEVVGANSDDFFDHELDGFTIPLRRESPWLDAGTYRVKIAINDIQDRRVNSAIFIEENSIFNFFLRGDLNGDDQVDAADFGIMVANWEQSGQSYFDGDLTGDGYVDAADAGVMFSYWGVYSERINLDFNRDGLVDCSDKAIQDSFFGMTQCASVFEGNTNVDGTGKDGDVDQDDVDALDDFLENAEISCGSQQAMFGGPGGSMSSFGHGLTGDFNGDGISLGADDIALITSILSWKAGNPDKDNDGRFANADVQIWRDAIAKEMSSEEKEAGEPTPAFPQGPPFDFVP